MKDYADDLKPRPPLPLLKQEGSWFYKYCNFLNSITVNNNLLIKNYSPPFQGGVGVVKNQNLTTLPIYGVNQAVKTTLNSHYFEIV